MKFSRIYSPTEVVFGEGTLNFLETLRKKYSNIFILATKSLDNKFKYEITKCLGNSIETFSVGKIKSEPTEKEINELLLRKTKNTDCVIGIGGGSYLDAAKALAIQERELNGFDDRSKVLPIVAIPTTAGTGSETSKGAVINQRGIKKGIRSDKLIPKMAIVDPRLCDSLPAELTLYTGFDALTHAIETYMSKKSSAYTRALSERSIRYIFTFLPRAIQEFEEFGKPKLSTRAKLSYAAMLQGINLGNSSTCLPHRIQYALSKISDASHAKGLASIYRSWLSITKPDIAGYNYQDMILLMNNLGINIRLSNLGIRKKDLNCIVQNVKGNLDNDPCFKGTETIFKILGGSL